MKKITFFICALLICGMSAITAQQFDFPAQAGPFNVAQGSPVTVSINDAGNSAGVTPALYSSFSVSVDWIEDAGGPYSSEADLTLTTTAGSILVDPPTTGSASNGDATTMTFEGDLAGIYDPSTDGFLEIVLDQSWSGTSANWSNIVVTLFEAPACPEPINLSTTVLTATTTELSWTPGNTESLWDVEVVDITGGGSATGNPTATDVGNPYTAMGLTEGNNYEFYVRANCGGDLSAWAGPFAWAQNVPPANDECDNAIALTVNPDYGCGVVTSGTTVAATASSQADDVSGTPNNDVWFSFVATNADHRVSLLNVVDAPDGPTSIDMGIGVYDGTSGCSSLVFTDTSDPNTLDLTGLNIGTTYLVRVYGWSSSSTSTAQTTFDVCVGTPPTCYEPTDLDASFVAPSSATLSWLAPTSGNAPAGYNWEVVPAGNGQGVGIVSSGSTADLTDTATGLTADTLYDFYVQSDCGGGDLSSWAGPFTFNAGYCIPVGTSTSTYIDNFSTTNAQGMNITNNGSGLSTDNYADNFAAMAVSGAPDGTFDFNVEIVSGTVGCAIFIDWNNDYVFDVSEAVYSTTSYGNGPFTGTVTIPNGTPNGDYRMRVMIDWNDSNPGNDAPCSFGSGRGEAEDYKVTVDSTLSTSNFEEGAAFTYYPNPVKNTLTLNAQNTIENVTMYNMLGQEVLRATPNAVNSELNMSNLQDGAYFVKVTIANVTKTIKVIKQ